MLTVSEAQERVAAVVERAIKGGADAADAIYSANASTAVQVRLGDLEDVSRSEGEQIGLRVFVGRRSASVSSSDLSDDAMSLLVERVVAMAGEAPEDLWAGLAPKDRLAPGDLPEVDSDDGADPAPADLKSRALAMEDVARSVAGVSNSEGAAVNAGRSVNAIATSHGFCRGYTSSAYSGGVSVIAGTGGGMQRDRAYQAVRHYSDLDAPEALGRLAGERAVARLDPRKLDSGEMPVVFDPRVGNGLLGYLIEAITGTAITRRASFLLDREGQRIFAPGVTIRDDPHRRRGLRSRPFDGEGLATAPTDLVTDGVLNGWLLDSASARQLGRQPTGHAVRGGSGAPGASASNVRMEPGDSSVKALIADVARGVYVTELIGQGVNPITGDYSRGASGFMIENGEIGPAVAEITIAGNLLDMFGRLVPADDLEFRYSINVPTVRIDGMTIAGA